MTTNLPAATLPPPPPCRSHPYVQQNPAASFETLLDYIVSVLAGLEALEEPELAVPWQTLLTSVRQDRDARDLARQALITAQRKVAVRDAAWDTAVTDLSGRAFLAAGKKADRPPYALLFAGVTADDARRLGPAKATAVGTALLRKGQELQHPDLADSLQRLAHANERLAAAEAARTQARAEAAVHEVPRVRAVDAVEALTAQTEVGILTRYPGRDDLVRAALAPQRSEPVRPASAADPVADPVTPVPVLA